MEIEVQKHDGSREKLDAEGLAARVRAGGLVFEIMDRSGDVKKIWDPTKEVEVEDARMSFDNLTKKGYRAFRTDAAGKEGELMKTFDPEAGRVVFVPQMQGG
jgi:hypothetical protein